MAGEITEPDKNPITEVRIRTDDALVIERTPKDPVTLTTTHVIMELKEQIAKYQGVIDHWQARITPLQAIIDEYDHMPGGEVELPGEMLL